MKQLINLTCVSLGLIVSHQAIANGLSWHASFGESNAHFTGGTQNIYVLPATVENQYTVNSTSNLDPAFGLGLAYQWDTQPVAFNLGLSFYGIESTAAGINTPFINGGTFDTLNYSAEGMSYVLMLEPKFILTTNISWQPYVLTGVGVSANHFGAYTETPTDPSGTASPTQIPFAPKTTVGFAYEFGLGIQHPLSGKPNAPILTLDYRYMSLGHAGLGDAGSAANTNLDFGRLSTQVTTLGMIWPL